MVTLGKIESLNLTHTRCKIITNQAFIIQKCAHTLKMHANYKNSTSP